MSAFSFFSKLSETLIRVRDWFIALGPLGVFLLALCDSFVPLPGGADFAIIAIATANPALAPVVVLAAAAGAVIGSTILYLGARKAGAAALARIKPERREQVENLLGRYDMVALAVAAILPPPFPFKAFNLSAGVLKINAARFFIAVLIGRLIRFGIEAFLAVQYGDAALDLIKQHALKVLGAVVVLGLGWWAWKRFSSEPAAVPDE